MSAAVVIPARSLLTVYRTETKTKRAPTTLLNTQQRGDCSAKSIPSLLPSSDTFSLEKWNLFTLLAD